MALLIKQNGEVSHITPTDGYAFLPNEIEDILQLPFDILPLSNVSVLAYIENQTLPDLKTNHWATALAWRSLKDGEVIKGNVLFMKIKELD